MTESRLVIDVTADTIEFPEEIDNTHETLSALFQHLENEGVIVDPQTDGNAEDKALRHSLCG